MNITNAIISHPRKFSFIFALLFCILFWSSTPRINVGYGDSDEFLAVGHSWGLAHPPGYSLYVTVLNIASRIEIPNTTEAQRMHGVSGLAAASAIYFISQLLFEMNISSILGKKKFNKATKVISIITATSILSLSSLFWLYAQIAEKYIFATPFVALLLLLGYRLVHNPAPKTSALITFGAIYGLLLSHHQSMVFLLPYIMYTAWYSRLSTKVIRVALILFVTVTSFVLPLGITAIQQHRSVQPSWYIVSGIQGIINIVTRSDFSGYIPKQITLSHLINGMGNYFQILLESTSWMILIPLIVSVVTLYKKNKQTLLLLSLPPFLLGVAIAAFLGWPSDLGSQATTSRFYIPSILAWTPIVFIGLYEILFRLRRFFQLLGVSNQKASIVVASVMLLPLIILVNTYPQISLKNFDLISRLYSKVLIDVKPNSVVTCYSDSSCFALIYEQTVNHLRPDVDIAPLAFPLVKNTISTKKLAGFTYPDNPYLMMDIVSWNVGIRPVYAVDISQNYYAMFGFDNNFLTYIPNGYAGEISKEMPLSIAVPDYSISKEYNFRKTPSFDLMRRFLIQSLSQTHLVNGYVWLRIGDRPRAQSELSLAMNLSYQLTDAEKVSSGASRSQIERTMSLPTYAFGAKSITSQKLLTYLPEILNRKNYNQAFGVARGAIIANPRNITARLELARIFEKMGDKQFTKREFQHVLLLDPQNKEAQQVVSSLSE